MRNVQIKGQHLTVQFQDQQTGGMKHFQFLKHIMGGHWFSKNKRATKKNYLFSLNQTYDLFINMILDNIINRLIIWR